MEAVKLTAEEMRKSLKLQQKIEEYQTTLNFEFEDFAEEDELNELLSKDDYEINRSFNEKWFGSMLTTQIIHIETKNRADAERLYDDIHSWADDDSNSVYINYSSII